MNSSKLRFFGSTMGCLLLLSARLAQGQGGLSFPVTPASPTDFETRNLGDQLSGVGTFSKPEPPKKIRLTFTVVSKLREWKNAKGAVVRGNLIAFEPGDHTDSQKALTLIREGKVRLLIEGAQNFHELALSSLSQADQEYVAGLDKARREAAAAATTTTK